MAELRDSAYRKFLTFQDTKDKSEMARVGQSAVWLYWTNSLTGKQENMQGQENESKTLVRKTMYIQCN
jgi:hypothetical protein